MNLSIGFTGTKMGMTSEQRDSLMNTLEELFVDVTILEFHHGVCKGADYEAEQEAIWAFLKVSKPYSDLTIHRHLPINTRHVEEVPLVTGIEYKDWEPEEYLDRNHTVVDESNILIATPMQFVEVVRSGTWATVRYARKQDKRIIIIYPDGLVEKITG